MPVNKPSYWPFIGLTTARARAPTAPTKNLYFSDSTISRQRRIFASGRPVLHARSGGYRTVPSSPYWYPYGRATFKRPTDSVARNPHRAVQRQPAENRGGSRIRTLFP
eukprot:5884805-Prymnesium_polylepis.1